MSGTFNLKRNKRNNGSNSINMPPKNQKKLMSLKPKTPSTLDDDDDFQNPSFVLCSLQKPSINFSSQVQKRSNDEASAPLPPLKKQKRSMGVGKENIPPLLGLNMSSPNSNSSSKGSKGYRLKVGKKVSGEFHGGRGVKSASGCLSDLIGEPGFVDSSKNSGSRVGDFCSGVEACELDEIDEKMEFNEPKMSFSSVAADEPGLVELSKNRGSSVDHSRFGVEDCGLSQIGEKMEFNELNMSCCSTAAADEVCLNEDIPAELGNEKGVKLDKGYLSNSIVSRLIAGKSGFGSDSSFCDGRLDEESAFDFDPGTQLNVLMNLCSEVEGEVERSLGVDFREENGLGGGLVKCPLCGSDISDLNEELRQVHSNDCLDKEDNQKVVPLSDDSKQGSPQQLGDVSPVVEWLRSLGLSRYEEAFVKEEVDWNTLQWLTEEDLLSIGVTALGPRKKIVHALNDLRKGNMRADSAQVGASKVITDEIRKQAGNKLITEYFPGSSVDRNRDSIVVRAQCTVEKINKGSGHKSVKQSSHARSGKFRDIPSWCSIPGTQFRVDAFRYLRRDCTHWFLTHFHMDHYQGLTRSFCHGKIYCSPVTAKLVHMKIGVPWNYLQVLPLNEKITIDGVNVTCLDANHCPGSVIILFEPPNGKAVLHTGDFRFSETMANDSILKSCNIQTLILDTTYCNPQYDFPKQEAVIQFVIEAIQAEAFNPKTLFLIGSYTIGKERLFLEVARCLRKKVYVGAAKLHLLQCLGLPEEDMQWFTLNEHESHIHVVPMWTIASFKRMKHISNQYSDRFNLIVSFSPTGWTFGKGKKKNPGRRWKQGTVIRYEVPYSEHCSFTELKEFVQFITPENIIPSVNNDRPESAEAMTALLRS